MKEKNSKKPLRFIFRYARPYKGQLLLAFVCSLVYVACFILVPILSGKALDLMVSNPNKVMEYIYIIIGLTVGEAVFYWLLSYLASLVSYLMARDMRKEALDRLLTAKLSAIDSKSHGDIISTLISDVDIISDSLVQTFLQFFTGFFTIIGTLVLMLVVCWPLAIVVIGLTPLSMVASYYIAKGTASTFKKQSDLRGKLNSLAVENLENQKAILSNNFQMEANQEFQKRADALRVMDRKTEFYSAIINPMTRMINAIIYGAVAAIGGVFIFKGQFNMTSGYLMSFLMFTNNYTQPFNAISEVISDFQNAFASAKRLEELMAIPQVSSDEGKKSLTDPDGSFDIEHVSFSYNPSRPLLKDIDIHVKPGMHVALVGPTGCGKTTLINLVMRFYDIDSGKILLSHQDTSSLTRQTLREAFGMVLQDTWIFNGTIRDNIRYSKLDASEEEIIQAAKSANADFFIRQMKNGYDTIVKDDASLSEGQKQLICIARLMLKKPKMLILDEATSNIDTRSELLIQQGFDQMMEGRTSLIIAHRLSTIVNADLILVLKDGTIIEKGTHEELLKQGGFYSELYNSQFAKA
jgi:ATP-binding cassette subfamily B multidrug efflux pump